MNFMQFYLTKVHKFIMPYLSKRLIPKIKKISPAKTTARAYF